LQEYQHGVFAVSSMADNDVMVRTPSTTANTRTPVDRTRTALLALLGVLGASLPAQAQSPADSDWGYYGGDALGQHYSSLAQIDRDNVTHLKVAWMYRTGELGAGFGAAQQLAFEATPVLAFGQLFLATPTNIVLALDPTTGRELWRHNAHIDRSRTYAQATSRGVSAWQDPDAHLAGNCTRRIFTGTLDARLIAIDAMTGVPCANFGAGGEVDLSRGRGGHDRAYGLVTSPPALFGGLVIVGSAGGDSEGKDVGRGVVRAFDARSGALRWVFDTLPESSLHAASSDWRANEAAIAGGGNPWAVMSVDENRGLVFAATGSASPSFYGGRRSGGDRFANSLIALDAAGGRLVWQQQLVHHDLWNYDLAAEPALIDITMHGVPASAVLEATKTGMLFVFERGTGKPLSAITESAVPQSVLPGEESSPTQPFPATPPLIEQRALRPSDAWGITFWDRGRCRALLAKYRNEGIFTPPDPRGTILAPGSLGGVNWGGIAYDARHQHVFAAVNHLPTVVTLNAPNERAEIKPLVSPWGLPCTAPPWGTLVSVDLRKNRIAWQVPLGSSEGAVPWFAPTRNFGAPNTGGPIATAGDLVFVAAAVDSYLRAFDIETGRELWKYPLPAGGQATPMTYRAGREQRQYLVIAAGGHGTLGTPRGDYVIAFALPGAAP
jgi:quinoprotein glucose dehydrogenase